MNSLAVKSRAICPRCTGAFYRNDDGELQCFICARVWGSLKRGAETAIGTSQWPPVGSLMWERQPSWR